MDRYETFATWIFIVFGALIIAGLMAFAITTADKPAFLFALASACAAFFLGFAVIFDQPRLYGLDPVCVGSADRGLDHCHRHLTIFPLPS